jgi:fibro-slime domain-containing protein
VLSLISALAASACSRSQLYTPEPCYSEGELRGCATGCGDGTQMCSGHRWTECAVPVVSRACGDACGAGLQSCIDGEWQTCDVPVAKRPCSDLCGSGEQSCRNGAWQTSCEVPPLQRDCTSVCGSGHETCKNGKWGACDAPQPRPPKLKATVRDFSPNADFEVNYPSRLDAGIVEPVLGDDDTPVYAGRPKTPTTSGADNFYTWFHDAPNNLSEPLDLQLTPSSEQPGLFEYANDFFFPIDGQLKGNEGRRHNYHFTLQASTTFEYRGGERFSFAGDDDMWVFINRRLAIDLGGTHRRMSAEVALDYIADAHGLVPGNVYPLHFFFAERHTISSTFTLRTTIADPGSCD